MTNRDIISHVAGLLGIEKIAWSRTMRDVKLCLADGFTEEDIFRAAENMAKTPKQYHSMYSLFNKIDYWLERDDKPEQPKGAW